MCWREIMAARWLPANTREFCFSLASLIENAERQLSSGFYDTSEFLLRRLDENALNFTVKSWGELWESTCSAKCYGRPYVPLRSCVLSSITFWAATMMVNKIDRPNTTPTVCGICTFAVYFSVIRPFCRFTLVYERHFALCYKEKTRSVRSWYGKF